MGYRFIFTTGLKETWLKFLKWIRNYEMDIINIEYRYSSK